MDNIIISYSGYDKLHRVEYQGKELYSTPDERDAMLFRAQLIVSNREICPKDTTMSYMMGAKVG